jgi:hypothetical protein
MAAETATANEPVAFARAPVHLFAIPQLSFQDEVSARTTDGPWFRLGIWTHGYEHKSSGVGIATERLCLLIPKDGFQTCFQELDSIGNDIGRMGRPGGSIVQIEGRQAYRYEAFHCFELTRGGVVGEPLVFAVESSAERRLAINPDVLLFLGLQEKIVGSGSWWDPKGGVEGVIHRVTENEETVQIRSDFLRRYLRTRQMSLLVGHYTHRHYFDPPDSAICGFVEENVTLGSPEERAKAIFQNWGLRTDTGSRFLQRRLHLWFEVRPAAIDLENPWTEEAPFDAYDFTFPTGEGPVAPGRWADHKFSSQAGRSFTGTTCDFMARIYFRQEVLSKYETSEGYRVSDDGSVNCQHYWGLTRSTSRLGNELVSTGIGDFAEGVPLSEWQHWAQYVVEAPSSETIQALQTEPTVCESVNRLVGELGMLNNAFSSLASSLSTNLTGSLWQGSIESLAGRQLKWVYSAGASDDEFVKRATLASTLVLEALVAEALRKVLNAIGEDLHLNEEKPPRPLGSRNLLQRLTLIAALISGVHFSSAGISLLVRQAEQKEKDTSQPDLQRELEHIYDEVRAEFGALAFLYDLRSFGGIAHPQNPKRMAEATRQLGLPERNWRRSDFLKLIDLVSTSIQKIASRFFNASATLEFGVRQG